MTHEELLKSIDWHETVGAYNSMAEALRAVVELHMSSPEGRYDNPICVECSFTETSHYVLYPCRNIQAIEKELK